MKNKHTKTPAVTLPSDIDFLNNVIAKLNDYIKHHHLNSDQKIFVLGCVNAIFAYAGEKAPTLKFAKKLNDKDIYQKYLKDSKLSKKSDLHNDKLIPLLTKNPADLSALEALIQDLKQRLSKVYIPKTVNEVAEKKKPQNVLTSLTKAVGHGLLQFFSRETILADLYEMLNNHKVVQPAKQETDVSNENNQSEITTPEIFGMFPNELIHSILEYVGPIEATKQTRVCRFFHTVINDNALWRVFLKRDFENSITEHAQLYQTSPKKLYKQLYLENKYKHIRYVSILVNPEILQIVNNPIDLLNYLINNGQLNSIYPLSFSPVLALYNLLFKIYKQSDMGAQYDDFAKCGYKFFVIGLQLRDSHNDINQNTDIIAILKSNYVLPNTFTHFIIGLNTMNVVDQTNIEFTRTLVKFNGKIYVNALTSAIDDIQDKVIPKPPSPSS